MRGVGDGGGYTGEEDDNMDQEKEDGYDMPRSVTSRPIHSGGRLARQAKPRLN